MLKSGLPSEIAKVLRDMYRLKFDKDLSFGERRLLDQARSLLVQELALAKKVPLPPWKARFSRSLARKTSSRIFTGRLSPGGPCVSFGRRAWFVAFVAVQLVITERGAAQVTERVGAPKTRAAPFLLPSPVKKSEFFQGG